MKAIVKGLKMKSVKNIHVLPKSNLCWTCQTEGQLPSTTDPPAPQHGFLYFWPPASGYRAWGRTTLDMDA